MHTIESARGELVVQSALSAYEELSSHLERLAPSISARCQRHEEYRAVVGPGGVNVLFSFFTWRPDSLEDAELHVGFYDGLADVPGFEGLYGAGRRLRSLRYEFQLHPSDQQAWIAADEEKREFTSLQLAQHVLGTLAAYR